MNIFPEAFRSLCIFRVISDPVLEILTVAVTSLFAPLVNSIVPNDDDVIDREDGTATESESVSDEGRVPPSSKLSNHSLIVRC